MATKTICTSAANHMKIQNIDATTLVPNITELNSIQNILHLLVHRNKNQHRRSKWWVSLGVLRRRLGRVVEMLERILHVDAEIAGAKVKIEREIMKKEREALVERAALEVRTCKDMGRGKIRLAFSSLVADNQYAAIGLMLLGTLARIDRILGRLGINVSPEPDLSASKITAQKNSEESSRIIVGSEVIDLGERIERKLVDIDSDLAKAATNTRSWLEEEEFLEELANDVESGGGDPKLPRTEPPDQKGSRSTREGKAPSIGVEADFQVVNREGNVAPIDVKEMRAKSKQKKRKKGDTFDDLFSSLM